MKDIFIGIFTGLLLTIFVFAMITEADAKTNTNTGLMGEDDQARIYSNRLGYQIRNR